jgi:hypothetical protein
MKSYTNLEQSQKLADILPIESADMFLALNGTQPVMSKYIDDGFVTADNTAIPCWSLAALLNYLREIDVFPEIGADKSGVTMNISFYDVEDESRLVPIRSIEAKTEDFVDTCYEMILKMHEQKLI